MSSVLEELRRNRLEAIHALTASTQSESRDTSDMDADGAAWSYSCRLYIMYIIEKLAPQNIGIANEIVSISVSVAELLVLPVWGYVSTSGLYLMLFSEVG